jgi:predicted nucleic acid-binding protein
MSDRYFVDTNILMYAHDTAAGDKHARAKALVEDLWQNRSGVVSTQVLQELAVNLRRKAKKPLDAKATREVVSDYLVWQVVVNAGDSNLEALDLESRYQISFWDALVIQAAQTAGARDSVLRGSVRRAEIRNGAGQEPINGWRVKWNRAN